MEKYILLLSLSILLTACGGSEKSKKTENKEAWKSVEFYGNAQGTTFSIICGDSINVTTDDIEKILDNFDLALSSYLDSSIVSILNHSPVGKFSYHDEYNYFNRCYKLSQTVYDLTNGAFDPTVYPLWAAWDFDEGGNVPDSATVDSLRALVGFRNGYHFTYNPDPDTNGVYTILKNTPNARVGFDAIAQGLAVDVVAEFLEAKGADNYYVEIGGELRVKGVNSEGELWRIGIDKPVEGSSAETREIQEVIQLKNKSIATSGSYRKFFIRDGVKYSHTIDPRTGYPVQHTLISASVVTESCAMADAFATAFMVMGAEKAMDFVYEHPELDLDVYFIFINDKGRNETFYSKDFRDLVVE